jgi:hypothetical protein
MKLIPRGSSTKGPAEMFTGAEYRVPDGVAL